MVVFVFFAPFCGHIDFQFLDKAESLCEPQATGLQPAGPAQAI
jgi:hypothetical protein